MKRKILVTSYKPKKEVSLVNKKIFSVLVGLSLVLGSAAVAFANGGALNTFTAHYPGTSYSCNLCHTSAPAVNAYGQALVNQGALPVTNAILDAVANADSDGDGFTNIAEINAGTQPGDAASKPSTPPPPPPPSSALTITSLNGGEVVASGSVEPITFDAPVEVTAIKVKYSLDGGLTWAPASGTVSAGGFDWNVPTPSKNKSSVYVKVIGFNGSGAKITSDKSDNAFSIETISVPTPAGVVPKGSTYTINWTVNGTSAAPASAKVLYTFDNGATWKPAQGTPGADPLQSFNWNVPSPAKGKNAKIKVVLKDGDMDPMNVAVGTTGVFRVE